MNLKEHLGKVYWKKLILDMVFICAGCAFGSFASIAVMIPNGLTAGGITGIARILQQFLPVNFSTLYYIEALIVLLICLFVLGKNEAKKIIVMSILYPSFLVLFEHLNPILLENNDMTLAAIFYGIIGGIGSGLTLSRGYSSGGSDTIAKMIKIRLFPHIAMSQILLIVDGIIIIASGFIFGKNVALYALISSVIFTKVVEMVMYGFDPKLVQLEIISEKEKLITDFVLHDIGRGVTVVPIQGAYTKEQKQKLLTICSPRESMLIKQYIARHDRNAFVVVLHIDTVWGSGKGFSNIEENNGK